MSMENLDLIALFNSHVLPHIVNIAIAIAIFVIGRWVVKIIKKILSQSTRKGENRPHSIRLYSVNYYNLNDIYCHYCRTKSVRN